MNSPPDRLTPSSRYGVPVAAFTILLPDTFSFGAAPVEGLGDVDGESDGDGDGDGLGGREGDGEGEGGADGDSDGEGEGDCGVPLQATPLILKSVGAGLLLTRIR